MKRRDELEFIPVLENVVALIKASKRNDAVEVARLIEVCGEGNSFMTPTQLVELLAAMCWDAQGTIGYLIDAAKIANDNYNKFET